MAAVPVPTAMPDPVVQPEPPLLSSNSSATFDPEKVAVVYILGGPGSGKGTQSEYLVRDFGFTHLSAGDLLRAEQERSGSQYGDLIKEYIRDGKIVPMEVTVKLLENAMQESLSNGRGKFLIDGFPRKMDQAAFFESSVCPSRCTLFLDCPQNVMKERLLDRGKTSGRSDDNAESIEKRFKTFAETSMPVVDAFEKEGKVVRVSAVGPVEDVHQRVIEGLATRGLSSKSTET